MTETEWTSLSVVLRQTDSEGKGDRPQARFQPVEQLLARFDKVDALLACA